MTHAPETGAIIRLPFFRRWILLRVTYRSGTGFVWHQIPAPNRTLLFQARNWHARLK